MSDKFNTDGLLMDFYAEDSNAEKLGFLCMWITQLNNGLMALDRSYMASTCPAADMWPEIAGAFHMVQTFGAWVSARADELHEQMQEQETNEARRVLGVEVIEG